MEASRDAIERPILSDAERIDRGDFAGAAWRFAERRMFVERVGDVSRHLLIALPSS